MINAPEPLTPPDCDLRDFSFMPLDVRRLLTSETWVLGSHAERVAAISLWCEAWHQVPAASLPDNDRMLAHLSGAGNSWKKVKDHALRGWVKCTDGRLYHPVVAEKARDAWAKKEIQRERSRKANAARWGNHRGNDDAGSTEGGSIPQAIPEDVLCASQTIPQAIPQGFLEASPNDPKGQGEGERQGIRKSSLRSQRARANDEDPDFLEFWQRYPRPAGKGAARKAWAAALAKAAPGQILAALDRAAWNPDPRYIPHPATWLNQERWTDAAPRDPVLSALGLDFPRDEPEPDPLRLRLQ
jgi:hypothetical protein